MPGCETPQGSRGHFQAGQIAHLADRLDVLPRLLQHEVVEAEDALGGIPRLFGDVLPLLQEWLAVENTKRRHVSTQGGVIYGRLNAIYTVATCRRDGWGGGVGVPGCEGPTAGETHFQAGQPDGGHPP